MSTFLLVAYCFVGVVLSAVVAFIATDRYIYYKNLRIYRSMIPPEEAAWLRELYRQEPKNWDRIVPVMEALAEEGFTENLKDYLIQDQRIAED